MKILLLLLLPLSFIKIDQTLSTIQDGPQLNIVSFKWTRARRTVELHTIEPLQETWLPGACEGL